MEELHLSQEVWDLIYPVGSICIFVNELNPNVLYGGTWEQIKDKFLLACGDIYNNGITGGEREHILTIDEMPSHAHDTYGNPQGNTGYGIAQTNNGGMGSNTYCVTMPSGGNQPHNNMPPYLTVYVWKRIA